MRYYVGIEKHQFFLNLPYSPLHDLSCVRATFSRQLFCLRDVMVAFDWLTSKCKRPVRPLKDYLPFLPLMYADLNDVRAIALLELSQSR